MLIIFKKRKELVLYDPQSDEMTKGKDIELLLHSVRKNTIKLLNISACFLNKSVLNFIAEA